MISIINRIIIVVIIIRLIKHTHTHTQLIENYYQAHHTHGKNFHIGFVVPRISAHTGVVVLSKYFYLSEICFS